MKLKISVVLAVLVGMLSVIDSKAMTDIRLVGVGNYFELLRTTPSERPAVRIVKVGNQAQNIFINPQTFQGQLQVVDLPLPIEVEVKFNTYNAGQPYTIVIERVTNRQDMLACQGPSTATVKASIKGRAAGEQKICVPLSFSSVLTSMSPIYSGDFNNIAFFIGPVGQHDTYDPLDVRSLPFSFGLMGWTSLEAPWNNQKFSQFSMVSSKGAQSVEFSKPLEVLQGFAALGGEFIPRAYHLTVGHVFNDSDDIIILSRESSQKALAPFNISQIVPPHSILPYAMVWVPKVKDQEEISFPGHDGLRIAALAKGETARAPGTITHSEIKELGPLNKADVPAGFAELEKLIAASLNSSVTSKAADLLGVTLWNKEMQSAYKDFNAANYYYVLATDESTRDTYLQKYDVKNNRLIGGSQKIENSVAYDTNGNPGYCNMVITKDKAKNIPFTVKVYPASLRAPRKR